MTEPATTEPAPNGAHDIYADVVAWASRQRVWENELVRRVAHQESLSEGDVEELTDAALAEHEQQQLSYGKLAVADFPARAMADARVRLKSVGDLRHVNALLGNQQLTFGDQLTVVFGFNASGKSGYGRVLKSMFRARVRDAEILPNLRSDEPVGTPAATVVTTGQHGDVIFPWEQGKELPVEFARFSVLDGDCLRTYVRADNELSVTPEGLDIPQRAIAGVDEVKRRLLARAAAARLEKTFLEALATESPSGEFVRTLSAATTREQIDKHTEYTEKDACRYETITKKIGELQQNSPASLRAKLQQCRNAATSLAEYASGMSTPVSVDGMRELRAAVEAHKAAAEAAAAVKAGILDAAMREDLMGTDPWRNVLAAAMAFAAQAGGAVPTLTVDDKCSLCWQELDDEARGRVERFVQYMEGEAERSLAACSQRLDEMMAQLREIPGVVGPSHATLATSLGDEWSERVNAFVEAAHARATAMIDACATGSWDDVPPVPPAFGVDLNALVSDIDLQVSKLGDEAAAQAEVASLNAEQIELRTREQLRAVKKDVHAFVQGLIESQRLEAAAAKINTLRYAKLAKALEDKYRTRDFERRFYEELEGLQFTRTAPVFHKSNPKGKSIVAPIVSADMKHIKAERVFSEGERTAIALSCYLAEVGLTEDTAGLVFDDPVSSMDHNYRDRVARRLVLEARKRQVIVFTHDLTFYDDLLQAAKAFGVDCQPRTMVATDSCTGIIENDQPFDTLKWDKRVGALRELLVDAGRADKQGDVAELDASLRTFYNQLRSAWERFIQERMFANAVKRLSRNISPGMLRDAVVTVELIEQVQEGYKRCSERTPAHDHDPGVGQAMTLTAATADLKLLEQADEVVKQARKQRTFKGTPPAPAGVASRAGR